MRIELASLVKVLDVLIEDIRATTGKDSIEIEEDLYWEVGADDRFDLTRTPEQLSVGQLTHDWERLATILDGSRPPIGYALTWLASVLGAVGPKVDQ